MKMYLNLICAATILLTGGAARAAIVYSNTTTDTLNVVPYETNAYTQVGDQITLAGTERAATTASVQFFNFGSAAGTFDATLRLFEIGAPVGAQIGGDFTVAGVAIPLFDIANVDFPLGGLVVPDNLIFTLSIANRSADVFVGPTMFDPPTIGSSDTALLIVNDGSFTTAQVGDFTGNNLYFELDAVTAQVPEPASAALLALGGLALIRRRRGLRPAQ